MSTNSDSMRQRDEWLRQMADAEHLAGSISVGGLASDLDMLRVEAVRPSRIFARFLQFARRARGLTVASLADEADVDASELCEIEEAGVAPAPRTVFKLAQLFKLPTGTLMELAGLAKPKHPGLSAAALRFAARSEPAAQLTSEEREALEEFVRVIVEASDQTGR